MTKAVFAIPGDKDRKTGGFFYEATVLRGLNDAGLATEHLQLPDSFPNPTTQDMATALTALRAIPKERPIILDGLVFGSIDPAGLAQVSAPVIAMVHHPLGLETGLSPERAAFLRANEAAALKHTAHTIVPSAHTARILVQDFGANPEQITVAPPGFARPVVCRVPANPPLILSVGLLATRKGHDVLLDALGRLTDLDWRAVIVGRAHDSDVAGALSLRRRQLGLVDRVDFAGELDAPALADHFNAAHIFALATRYEGYGMVLSEAMLYGLPVVSCSVGAVPDTVADAGILTPPDDPKAFAQAIRGLLEDPEKARRYGRRSQARAESLPTWRDTVSVFETVIREVTRSRLATK